MPFFGQQKHGLKQNQETWLKDRSKNHAMTDIDFWLNKHGGKTVENYVDAWIEECAKEPTTIHLHQHDGLYGVLIENLEKADRFGIAIDRNGCPIKASGKLIDFFRSSGNGNIVLENSVFHAAEMEAEVGKQSLVDRIISFFYRWLSNYGGSSVRPLIICGVLLSINFILLFLTDGVTLIGEVREVDGWHYYLYGFDDTARFLRAAVFSISQMFNPLGIFGTRLLLSAKTPTIALVSALLGLASTIAFALFVLAVRRRFRLDRSS